MNWTGHVVAAPRSDLAALLQRPETSRTGIYILLGDDPENYGGTLALESRFITQAQQARRSRLINGTAPPPLPLPEADVSDMEYFIAQAKIILPVLGVNILRSAATAASHAAGAVPASAAASPPVFELHVRKDGISATAREIDGEFAVLEGSGARVAWTGVEHAYKVLREQLVRKGRSSLASTAGRCDSPATRCSLARAPRRPSWWDGPRMGATTGRSKVRVLASAPGRPRVLSKLSERDRCEQPGSRAVSVGPSR